MCARAPAPLGWNHISELWPMSLQMLEQWNGERLKRGPCQGNTQTSQQGKNSPEHGATVGIVGGTLGKRPPETKQCVLGALRRKPVGNLTRLQDLLYHLFGIFAPLSLTFSLIEGVPYFGVLMIRIPQFRVPYK